MREDVRHSRLRAVRHQLDAHGEGVQGWGPELTTEVTTHEAGLERFLNLDLGDFKGHQATLDMAAAGPRIRIVYMEIADGDNDAYGTERIFHDGREAGLTTSGAYGHTTGKSLAFG